MKTPTRLVISNGTVANDGTGDTLYDATTKINQNFEKLWSGTYNDEFMHPGRAFVFSHVTDSAPDSGEFTMTYAEVGEDSEAFVRISKYDTNDKSYRAGLGMGSIDSCRLSVWELDSGSTDDWSLECVFDGSASYVTDHWEFTISSTSATGSLDSDKTYYLGLDGVW